MDFNMSDRQKEWLNRVQAFMHTHVPDFGKGIQEWRVILRVAIVPLKGFARHLAFSGSSGLRVPPSYEQAGAASRHCRGRLDEAE